MFSDTSETEAQLSMVISPIITLMGEKYITFARRGGRVIIWGQIKPPTVVVDQDTITWTRHCMNIEPNETQLLFFAFEERVMIGDIKLGSGRCSDSSGLLSMTVRSMCQCQIDIISHFIIIYMG